jgi:hypothetical protein
MLAVLVALITVAYLLQALWWRVAVRPRPMPRPLAGVDLRVDEMLHAMLDTREYEVLTTRGYLDVASPSHPATIYRIPRRGGMVTVYAHGRATLDLCVRPEDPLPTGDVVLLHKLMIQGNEEEYLARAHQYLASWFGHRYRP